MITISDSIFTCVHFWIYTRKIQLTSFCLNKIEVKICSYTRVLYFIFYNPCPAAFGLLNIECPQESQPCSSAPLLINERGHYWPGEWLYYMVVSRTCTGGAADARKSNDVLTGAGAALLFTVVLSLALLCSSSCCW